MTQPIGMGGSMPQLNRSGETPGPKALFHSVRDIALIKDKTIAPGYGVLNIGTIMATNPITGDLVPYTTTDHQDNNVGRCYLVADALAATDVYTTLRDSYKLQVGDELIFVRDNTGTPVYHDGGVITAIDRETEPHRAKISFTTILPDTTFTTANTANCYVKSGSSGKFSTATFILDKDTYTGEDETAIGANVSVLISNAIVYLKALVNFDADAATDLGTMTDGSHVILK